MSDDVTLQDDERGMIMLAIYAFMKSCDVRAGSLPDEFRRRWVALAKKIEGVDKQLIVRDLSR